jgi:hypothetical protein
MRTNGIGSSAAAAVSGENPFTNCRYCMTMKKKPKAAKNCALIDSDPVPNPRSRNSRGSSMGAVARSSTTTNRARATAPPTRATTTDGSSHPDVGPSMIPNTSAEMPTSDSTALPALSAGGSASRLAGTSATVPINAMTARATLRAKNEFQENHSRSRPAPNRPSTAPPPATPTHTPTARPRSSAGNEVVITDKVVGITNAAPTPIPARRPIRTVGSDVNIAPRADSPNTARPPISVSRRPNRSPTAPANNSRPANTTV